MKVLNLAEIQIVSGGFDGVTALCVLSAANLFYSFYNSSQISKLDELQTAIMFMNVYQQAQLRLLPHFNEIQALNIEEAAMRGFPNASPFSK